MKIISANVAFYAAVVALAAVQAQADDRLACGDRGLLLTISVPQGTYKADAQIPLTLDVLNTGQEQIHTPTGFTYTGESRDSAKTVIIGSGTYIICEDQKTGKSVSFKGLHAKVSGPGRTVKAGEKIKAYTLDLKKCFNLEAGRCDV